MTGLLYGVGPVVVAVVLEAVLRIGRRTLHPALVSFAVAAFVAIYFLSVPFPLVVAAAALAGFLLHKWYPDVFRSGGHGSASDEDTEDDVPGRQPSLFRAVRLVGTFALLWAAPVGTLVLWRGGEDVLVDEALFFTGAAFVTFGERIRC
ncbi:MAG: Chromate transport protein ChrA [uncultured Rubrobacteraceae bacterium]|uniref:Chromate transport protein ChrA n=1 Tax=uncultured Rubrobacteraceae bacterium TaxID=349277 RepID=A0A6J4QJI5_9ACTN|nr:MAG: Chromate transport protein ChrA [uncultured Rubrobacteraceae bacterium]